ncbi:MAG TPA: PspC domain-containing protein [Clostridia bacterium]|nr:PspC domain-containing protein [Clostridia bacterium]
MKKLYRSRNDSMLTGVCGGLGEYFNIDATLIRLAFALFFFTGIGIFVYFIAAIILPKAPLAEGESPYKKDEVDGVESSNTSFALGVLLVFIGLALLIKRYILPLMPHYMKGLIWPLVFIGLGAYLVWGRKES